MGLQISALEPCLPLQKEARTIRATIEAVAAVLKKAIKEIILFMLLDRFIEKSGNASDWPTAILKTSRPVMKRLENLRLKLRI